MAQVDPSDVRLVYFEECPNWRLAEAHLKEALVSMGVDPDTVIYEQVTTVEHAEALGFRGSPTILVDGIDPFADPDAPAGLTCRIYRTATGATQPAPTVEQIQGALARCRASRWPRPYPREQKLMVSTLDLFDDGDLSEPVARAVRSIAVLGFQALWSGQSVTLTELLGEDGAALTEATEHLRSRGRIELTTDGHLIAVHGLSHRPTLHEIERDDAVINTWCALDAIGIPAALGIDAWARTKCPTCQRLLAVRLSSGNPRSLPGAVLRYPEVACGHLIEDFCSGANLFCTIEHLERWGGGSPGAGTVITIDEVAEIGREVWADAADLLREGEER